MEPNRRQVLALIASTGTVSLAGCSGGDDDGGDGNGGDNGDAESPGDNGGNGGDGGGNGDDSGSGNGDDSGSGNGDDDGSQADEITGTVESSVDEIEVLSHEVVSVNLQVRIDVELRNAGEENNIAFTHHNFEGELFDASGNAILRELNTRGPDENAGAGETRVVTLYLLPESETDPASYEVTINCDARATGFNYCEG